MKSSPKRRRPPLRGRVLGWLAALVTRLVPRRLGYWLGDLAASLFYLLGRRYRRAVLANMSQVLGRPTSDPIVRAAARRCFQTSARNFWDLCSLPHTRRRWLVAHTERAPEEWQRLQSAVARGQGVVAVTAHLGAFDYVGQLLVLLEPRPLILTAQTTSGWVFQAVTWLRSSWGAAVEPVTPGALRRIITHLRQGGLVGLVADRDVYHNGRPIWFFGRPTTLPVGAVRMAQETGAAMVAIFCPRLDHGYCFVVEEVPIVRSGDSARDLEINLARLAEVLERHIRRWPDQWVMFERMWPEGPPSGINVGELGIP